MRNLCPNCLDPVKGHFPSGCVLNAFIELIRDRGTVSAAKLRKIHLNTNIDQLWDELDPIVARLEAGEFNVSVS